jgi:beta-galactosidase
MNPVGRLLSLCLISVAACVSNERLAAAAETTAPAAPTSPRIKMTLNDGWRFLPEDRFDAESMSHDDAAWQPIDVPHTWNAHDPFDDAPGYRRGQSWYRKRLAIDPQLKGKRLFLYFEGVHQKADVYMNGRLVGRHKGGYSAFCFDVTKFVRFPQAVTQPTTGPAQSKEADLAGQTAIMQAVTNVLAVRADSSEQDEIAPLSIGYAHYGGIYRDVWLIATDPVHFDLTDHGSPGVFVDTPKVSAERATIRVRGTVVNDSDKERKVGVRLVLSGPAAGNLAGRARLDLTVPARGNKPFETEFEVTSPQLWSPDSPTLYDLTASVLDLDGSTATDVASALDEYATHAGFRWFKFDPNEGFLLNGKRLPLRGASRHQDFKGLGSALSNAQHRRDLQWLKDMGANFIRIAHYPQDPEVLETADRLGLVAWEEIPVVSTISPSPEFTRTCETMMREMIRQHYNHPCVVMWGTMNESLLDWGRQQNRDPEFPSYVKKLADALDGLARKEDPTRATTLAMNQGDSYDKAGIGAVPVVAGWNLYSGWYGGVFDDFGKYMDRQHQNFPDRVLFVSEYGAGDDERLHSLKPRRFDHSIEWMLMYHEAHLRQIAARPYLAGVAIWNEFDFSQPNIGDTIPHMNQKGMLTWDRRPKPAYYLYQANWSTKPMLHIVDWPKRAGAAGGEFPVKVYSNCPEVELLLNGKSLGTKQPDDVKTTSWTAVFQPGENLLEARAATAGSRGGELRDFARVSFKSYPTKLNDPATPFEEIAVNAGGNTAYTDPQGLVWLPDQPYASGSWGHVDGAAASEDHWKAVPGVLRPNILGTDEDPLYQAFRRGMEAYRFDVPDGDYELELRFAEYFPNAPGLRVFRVSANGQTLIDRLDLGETPGPRRALSRTFTTRAAGGKGLEVRFDAIVAKPVVSAIRVRRVR